MLLKILEALHARPVVAKLVVLQLSSNPLLDPLLAERLLLALAALGVPTEARPRMFRRAMGVIFNSPGREACLLGVSREKGKSANSRGIDRTGALTDKPMNRVDAWRMVQRRAADLGARVRIGCHTFRATGITAYLEAGGTLEKAQAMAGHESPRTTKLYDRTGDEITLDEVERITI